MIFVAFGGDDNLTLLVKLLEWLTSMGQSTLSTPELISGDRLINSDILKTLCVFSFCLKKDLEWQIDFQAQNYFLHWFQHRLFPVYDKS